MRSTNYSVLNIDNVYKFCIVTMETLTDEQNIKFVENMKLQIGMSYYDDFKLYVYRKMPKSKILEFLT